MADTTTGLGIMYDFTPRAAPGRAVGLLNDGDRVPLVLTTLSGKDLFFGAAGQPPAYDWPNPLAAMWRAWFWPRELITLLESLVGATLAGRDQFFGAAGQPPANVDWPNPIGGTITFLRRSYVDLITFFSPGLQEEELLPYPFSLLDWPNPIAATRRLVTYVAAVVSSQDGVAQRMLNLILGQDTFFGAAGQPPANTDWPNPIGAIWQAIRWPNILRIIGQELPLGSKPLYVTIGASHIYYNSKQFLAGQTYKVPPKWHADLLALGATYAAAPADAATGNALDWTTTQNVAAASVPANELAKPTPEDKAS